MKHAHRLSWRLGGASLIALVIMIAVGAISSPSQTASACGPPTENILCGVGLAIGVGSGGQAAVWGATARGAQGAVRLAWKASRQLARMMEGQRVYDQLPSTPYFNPDLTPCRADSSCGLGR